MPDDKDALIQGVLMAAERFVQAHLVWTETQPWHRKPCLQPNAVGESCFAQAMRELESLRQEGCDGTISPGEVEDWCANCQHNWRMVQKRGERANARAGAIRWLVRAVEKWRKFGAGK